MARTRHSLAHRRARAVGPSAPSRVAIRPLTVADPSDVDLMLAAAASGEGWYAAEDAGFLEQGLAFGRERWAPATFALDVYEWNERAIRA